MANDKVTFKTLTDLSRLPEIHSLTHDTFVEGKYIRPRKNGILDLYPHLDRIEETTIIIGEINGEIIATNSVTTDSVHGLHTDSFFKNETNELRQQYENIGSSWRIATHQKYRGDYKLVVDLIKYTLHIGEQVGIETCLFLFLQKHIKVYERLIGAKTIATRVFNMEDSNEFQKAGALMIADTSQIRTFLNGRN